MKIQLFDNPSDTPYYLMTLDCQGTFNISEVLILWGLWMHEFLDLPRAPLQATGFPAVWTPACCNCLLLVAGSQILLRQFSLMITKTDFLSLQFRYLIGCYSSRKHCLSTELHLQTAYTLSLSQKWDKNVFASIFFIVAYADMLCIVLGHSALACLSL